MFDNIYISRRQFLSSTWTIPFLLIPLGPIAKLVIQEAVATEQIAEKNIPPKIIEDLEVQLSNELVAKDRLTIIWADTIRLSDQVKTNGNSLILTARRVHSNFTLGAILAKVRLSPSVKDAQS